MKCIRYALIFLVMALLISGCSKKSGIEGKVVDWKRQPMSGVRIIAKQMQPAKGYEQFEAVTNSDGSFQYNRVFPKSEYALTVMTDQWKTEQKTVVRSGEDGKMNTAPLIIVVRFTISHDGVITDTKTGLQWVPMPEYTFSRDGAIDYAKKLTSGGHGDWRLPTRGELQQLYDASVKDELAATFHIGNNTRVWSSEMRDARNVWVLDLLTGREDFTFRGNSMGNMAMVAVHTP